MKWNSDFFEAELWTQLQSQSVKSAAIGASSIRAFDLRVVSSALPTTFACAVRLRRHQEKARAAVLSFRWRPHSSSSGCQSSRWWSPRFRGTRLLRACSAWAHSLWNACSLERCLFLFVLLRNARGNRIKLVTQKNQKVNKMRNGLLQNMYMYLYLCTHIAGRGPRCSELSELSWFWKGRFDKFIMFSFVWFVLIFDDVLIFDKKCPDFRLKCPDFR